MLKSLLWCLLFSAIIVFANGQSESNAQQMGLDTVVTKAVYHEAEMVSILKEYNEEASKVCREQGLADWAVATDVGNEKKEEAKTQQSLKNAAFFKKWYDTYWKNASIDSYKNASTKRQLKMLKQLGQAVLDEKRLEFLTKTQLTLATIYNAATVCPYKDQQCAENAKNRLTLDPDITERFANSRNFDELQYLWVAWRNATGQKMRDTYKDYVELENEVARGNGFKDGAEYWMDDFEDPKFEENMDALWEQVKPLYDELHTYMRYKLLGIYGKLINRTDENIPAHLLGNMWAQTWENLYQETKPFQNATKIDVTQKLKELKYDARKMFETSDDFYMSLGLPSNRMSYTSDSIIEKPTNRTIQCHASAWDFCDGKDFRIKMCTNINQEDLIVIHHEMGHIQYYIQYADQPDTFRKGANPGFHEAVGDTIALSVANPKHLVKIGLLDSYTSTKENDINALYQEALQRVAFLPFGLLIDKWRWDVFRGSVPMKEWNKHWWDLRKKYQKVTPPVERSSTDFDPGAKFHVATGSKYISYFVAFILEFMFYKSLCIEAGQYNPNNLTIPLHQCDFYKSKAAGKKLSDGLKLGGSEHWSVALQKITNETQYSASAILEYFNPLRVVLKSEIERLKAEDEVRQKLEKYNEEALIYSQEMKLANWAHTTNLNDTLLEMEYVEAVSKNAAFNKNQYETIFSVYKNETYPDEKINRQIKLMGQLETNILNETQLKEFTTYVNDMVKIYNTAQFCPYNDQKCLPDKQLTLEPEMVEVFTKSRNYSELEYTWKMWHDLTGPQMKPIFKKYIELNNEAARLNGYADAGEMWRARYEDPKLLDNLNEIWTAVKPLYQSLHTYTKNKLNKIYGDEIVDPNSEYIPANLLSNMWAQSWAGLYEDIKPFNGSDLDITAALKKAGYTPLKIFQEADRFYKSLGLESNEMSYTGESIIEKPQDRLIVCHASAWDFSDGKDFRIKQCTVVNQKNFVTAHHEMGHIQYYILYKDQPILFRAGANPGFHEAVGDVMALSVANPNHLKKVGLLGDYKDTDEDSINALFKMALERVAFLPFGLLIDLYRFDLFSGKINYANWNQHWEKLRQDYQGVTSPVPRNESSFDAGGKFHVPSDYSYLAYFVAHIAEFQIFRSLCIAAGQYDPNNTKANPLHKCDIEGSLVAGQRLRDGLSLGASKHWSEVMNAITKNDTTLEPLAILEYFQPLKDYLDQVNSDYSSGGSGTGTGNGAKWPWIFGGFAILIGTVAIIGYLIFYYNRK